MSSWDRERPCCTRCNNTEKQKELQLSIARVVAEIAAQINPLSSTTRTQGAPTKKE